MDWLNRLLGRPQKKYELDASQQERFDQWQHATKIDYELPHLQTRYIVVDVEASGLHLGKDRLIAIGAVAVTHGLISIKDTFQVVLKQDQVSSNDNILIHGIGGQEQREGKDPVEALLSFLNYIGNAPLVAYHARFDQVMIDRAMDRHLGGCLTNSWIDLAWIIPEFFDQYSGSQVALDDWLNVFGIENIVRHNALSDAYATAQLLQIVIAHASETESTTAKSLIDRERIRRWMLRTI